MIALASEMIMLGINSELGLIDPQLPNDEFGQVPAEFIRDDPSQSGVAKKMAEAEIARAETLAKKYLTNGMLAGQPEDKIKAVVTKLSSTEPYRPHGAVIDYEEAR